MTIYVCTADDSSTHLQTEGFDVGQRRRFVEQGNRASPSAVAAKWTPVTFVLQGNGRKSSGTQDVYAASTYAGTNLVVSGRCRAVIEGDFPGQCTFLEVTLKNAAGDFFALWCNHEAEDALDTTRSVISADRFGTKHLTRYAFHEERLQGIGLFRLPLAYAGAMDFATESFVNVARRSGLTGFVFWNRAA